MIDILRDPVWSFVGVVLALVTTMTGWLVGRTRRRKSVTYVIDSNEPLLIGGTQVGGLQVVLDGKTVTDARSIAVTITNSGNLSIKPDDYERMEGLKIRFDQDREILSASVTESWPAELTGSIGVTVEGTGIVLTPALLNAGDTFTVRALVRGGSQDPTVVGRIVGVKSVVKVEKRVSRRRRFVASALLITLFEAMLFLVGTSLVLLYGLWIGATFVAGMNFLLFAFSVRSL